MAVTWPVTGRADSLQIDFFYLQRMVGNALGFGYNPAQWDDVQTEAVQEMIDEGLRTYYYPPPLTPPWAFTDGTVVHEWSFMRPIWRFQTEGNVRRYALPENWERPIGNITYQLNEGDYYDPIRFTSPQRTLELENRQEYTSPPSLASVEPGEATGTSPQTLELTLHPTPDTTYLLQVQYQAHARRLGKDNPFPLGGQMHGPGLLAACLAVSEYRATGAQGPAWNMFMQKLAGNIARDNERGAAFLGYNGNAGHDVFGRGTVRRLGGLFYRNTLMNNVSFDG